MSCNCYTPEEHHRLCLGIAESMAVITVPLQAWDDLLDGVKAMGERAPQSRAEWMARDFVKAVRGRA